MTRMLFDRRGAARVAGGAVLVLLGAGCVDMDPAVFVEGSIESPSATVQSSALATGVEGQLSLRFHLGARANGDSQVTLRGVSVSNADRTQTLIETLKVGSDKQYPLAVVSGGDDPVALISYSADDNLFETEVFDAICQAGEIVITITFEDSLLGATSLAVSDPFAVSGCP